MHVAIVDFARDQQAYLQMLLATVYDCRADAGAGTVVTFSTGVEALQGLHDRPVDVVFVGAYLPDMDAAGFVRELRVHSGSVAGCGVIALLPEDATESEHLALEARFLNAGGDAVWAAVLPDQVTEVYRRAFAARVRQVTRRASGVAAPVVDVGPLRVDLISGTLAANGIHVPLTAREYAVVEILARASPRRVSAEQFLRTLYPDTDAEQRVVSMFIYKIRRKLERHGPEALAMLTFQQGAGYALRPDPGAASDEAASVRSGP